MDTLRKYINIVEGRDAPLYHAVRPEKVSATLNSNTLKGTWIHDIPGLGKRTGISLTRNKNVKYDYVLFVFDQARLAQRFKIIPVDGEHLFYKSDKVRDRSNAMSTIMVKGPNNLQLSEEFLIGDIANLSNYLLEIQLVDPTHGKTMYTGAQLKKLFDVLSAYSKKHNIPLKVDPIIQRQLPKPKPKVSIPNKYIVMDITDNDEIKLALLKNDAALEKFKAALSTGTQDSFYKKATTNDYMVFDDWEGNYDGGPRTELVNGIYLLPLTTPNRREWYEVFYKSPEQYMLTPDSTYDSDDDSDDD